MVNSNISSSWDRTLFNYSSLLNEPFCYAYDLLAYRLWQPLSPDQFDNCSSKIAEIAIRSIIVLGALTFAFLVYLAPLPILCSLFSVAFLSKVLRTFAFYLQKDHTTHVKGTLKEKEIDPENLKLMTWNIAGISGGMSKDHAGVNHWRYRLDGICEKIKKESADVLVLEEIYDISLAEALVKNLNDQYAHFYLHLGKNILGSMSGLMVLTKCSVSQFSFTPFENNSFWLSRGFATLDLKKTSNDIDPYVKIIGTHLIHDSSEKRKSQIDQIVSAIKDTTVPTFLMGDLNIERDGEEGKILDQFKHSYKEKEPTCTNELVFQWSKDPLHKNDENIDYISLYKSNNNVFYDEASFTNWHLLKGVYDEKKPSTKTALSDHKAVVATVDLGLIQTI
jgi:endonuclease/exonuclease/phosphatase family metal-dependent hydrolase